MLYAQQTVDSPAMHYHNGFITMDSKDTNESDFVKSYDLGQYNHWKAKDHCLFDQQVLMMSYLRGYCTPN